VPECGLSSWPPREGPTRHRESAMDSEQWNHFPMDVSPQQATGHMMQIDGNRARRSNLV